METGNHHLDDEFRSPHKIHYRRHPLEYCLTTQLLAHVIFMNLCPVSESLLLEPISSSIISITLIPQKTFHRELRLAKSQD